jgi:hypothetical protein
MKSVTKSMQGVTLHGKSRAPHGTQSLFDAFQNRCEISGLRYCGFAPSTGVEEDNYIKWSDFILDPLRFIAWADSLARGGMQFLPEVPPTIWKSISSAF